MHNTIRVGEMSVTFLKTRHETGGACDLFELTIPAFARVPLPHLHRKYDETIFGVDGTSTWTLRDKATQVRRGVTLFIPRGTPHFFANLTHTTALFRTNHQPDLAGIGAVMSRYGVVPITQKEDLAPIQPDR